MELRVSKDIRKYKTKDIGNFSLKEAGLLLVGLAAAGGTYSLTGSLEVALIPMMVFFAFAFLKPFGLTMMQFLRTAVRDFLSPHVYFWETDFEYDVDEFPDLYGEDVQYDLEDDALTQREESFRITKQERDFFLQ